MNFASSTYALALATFIQTIRVTVATKCSYTSFDEVVYYTCLSNQYCCGRDSCCHSNDYYYGVYDLWYFWFCLCFGIFICSLASGAYYRKRQLRGVQVAPVTPRQRHQDRAREIRVMHGHGAVASGLGTEGLIRHAPPRNLLVTATAASGQPVYPDHGFYEAAPPNYPVYAIGGPVYPAYAYMPPPPAYSSLAPVASPPSSTRSASTGSSSSSLATNGADVPTVS